MSKRNVPATSKEAYGRAKENFIKSHHEKILEAFRALGSATADQIAARLGMEHEAVNRRFSELSKKNLIYNTYEKKNTRKGNSAYVFTLNETGEKVEKKPVKALAGKAIVDHSRDIMKITKGIQQNLF
jgi:predicted ArsR family transcriptional regulator